MAQPQIITETTDTATVFRLTGRLVTEMLHEIESAFSKLTATGKTARIDLSGLDALDTAGASLIATLQRRMEQEGKTVEISGATAPQAGLIEKVEAVSE